MPSAAPMCTRTSKPPTSRGRCNRPSARTGAPTARLLDALAQLLVGTTFGDPRIGFVPVAAAPDHARRRLTTTTGTPLPALQVRAAVGAHLGRTANNQVIMDEAEAAVAADLAEQVQALLETAVLPGASTASPGRPVRPGDIAVLIGKHSEAPVIQSALRRRGIPAVVARGGSVLESVAATHWRWLLTALARPADPARARTVALSWFFGWSVARIDAADETELADVQEQLFSWAEILETHGTIDFCAHVWSDSGVVARVLASPDGDRDLTDLDHIAGLLQTTSDSQRPTALGLLTALTQMDALKDLIDPDNDVTARQVESEAEAVQIMTVYVAKGLEFPVVCVPTLWRRNSTNDVVFQSPITGNRTFDIAPSQQWPTKKESELRKEMANDEALGDSLRLLYVALTRAQHQTLLWWSGTSGSDTTGLAHVLFGRTNGAIDPDLFSARRVALPDDADLKAELDVAFAPAGDAIAVTVPGPAEHPVIEWTDEVAPRPPSALELAVLGRTPVRTNRRWSFTAISGRAHAEDIDPEDESLGDAGAADEPAEAPEHEETGTDLPLGAVPGGPQFGTLVHEVLERTDFAADDLEAELRNYVGDALRWNAWPIDVTTLVTGLRAAIETPMGPLLSGLRLRDFTRRDYLRELDFELRLGESARPATDRDIGALILHHLPPEDPLRSWAESLAVRSLRRRAGRSPHRFDRPRPASRRSLRTGRAAPLRCGRLQDEQAPGIRAGVPVLRLSPGPAAGGDGRTPLPAPSPAVRGGPPPLPALAPPRLPAERPPRRGGLSLRARHGGGRHADRRTETRTASSPGGCPRHLSVT